MTESIVKAEEDELESLVKLLGSQLRESGWIESELARKQVAGEKLVNIHDFELQSTTTEISAIEQQQQHQSTEQVVHSQLGEVEGVQKLKGGAREGGAVEKQILAEDQKWL